MGAQEPAEYRNDPFLSDDEILYRRVRNDQWVWAEGRPQSGAFDDSPDGSPMSVAIHSRLRAVGLEPKDLLAGHPQFGLVSLTVGFVRSLGFAVTADPPVAGEPAHAWVAGKKTTSRKRRMAKKCVVEIHPPPLAP